MLHQPRVLQFSGVSFGGLSLHSESPMIYSDDLSVLAEDACSRAVAQLRELINGCDSLSFLIGAGCSKCAGLPLTKELTDAVLSNPKVDSTSKKILNGVKAVFADAQDAHIEDYLSEIIDLLAITDRRAVRGVEDNTIAVGDAKYVATQLRQASDQIKRAIADEIQKTVNTTVHQDFIGSVHRPARVGRPAPGQPVDYLVLNYDTVIEDSLALQNIPYADGIYGGTTGWWEPTTFGTAGLAARVIKLHGSIDWRVFPDENLPRRVGPSIKLPFEDDLPVLIWPSSTKYQETQMDPFAQLMDQARTAMRPRSGSQSLLVICGYSFGDSHINLEIDKALQEADGQLTVAAFTDCEQPVGQLKSWYDDPSLRKQVLIFAKGGFFHGDNANPSQHDLPWWQFQNLTKILRGDI